MKINLLKKIGSCSFVIIIFSCSFWITTAKAQTWPDSSKSYHLFLEAYLFTPAMSGNLDIGPLPKTFICIPASDVISHLKFGAMLYAEVHNDKFAYTSDIMYASLGQSASSKNGVISGDASVKQFWWEAEGLYKVQPWFEVGVGARINSIEN